VGRVASGFVVQGLEDCEREGALAGEEQGAVFGGKEVVEFGLGEDESRLAFGRESPLPDLELCGLFGLEGDLNECFVVRAFGVRLRGEVETWADLQRSSGHRSAASPGSGKQ
jgi:hypothetical protein